MRITVKERLKATMQQRLCEVQAIRSDALDLDSLPVEHGPQSLLVGSVDVEEIAIERERLRTMFCDAATGAIVVRNKSIWLIGFAPSSGQRSR